MPAGERLLIIPVKESNPNLFFWGIFLVNVIVSLLPIHGIPILQELVERNAMKTQAAVGDGATGLPQRLPVVAAPHREPGSSRIHGEGGRGRRVGPAEAISASDYPFFRYF